MRINEHHMQELFDAADWARANVPNYANSQLREDFYKVTGWYFTGQEFSQYEIDMTAFVSFEFMSLKHRYGACSQHCLYCKMGV